MPSLAEVGEGNNPAGESGDGGASPPAYGERNVGKDVQSTWEALPGKELGAIRQNRKAARPGGSRRGS